MTSLQGRCRKGLLAVIFFAISAVCLAADSELSPSPFDRLTHQFEEKAGVHLLEYGEDALMARAWLTSQSTKSIDVQYFIWSTDNIGILAGEALLSAADRGVQVRVLVDDLLIDAENKTILVLDAHPNVQIKIYNPNYNVGTNAAGRMFNILKDFRGINQRMHDKVAIFDGVVGITGGRNMADEYFDYDHHYNFRDRDALVVGSPVAAMSENFNEFWGSEFAMPVSDIFADMEISTKDVESHYHALRAYSSDPENFEPEIRAIIDGYDEAFAETLRKITVADIEFISDHPGKNNFSTLGGGSITSDRLLADILAAKESILIQSPYLILSDDLIEVLAGLIHKGVSVTISTNSLASTDNLYAFSGYQKQRQKIMKAGIKVYEYKSHPADQIALLKRHHRLEGEAPVFALHAKSMVIDNKTSYIGSFNLDPRSANLNTEVGLIISNTEISKYLTNSISNDIRPENSWVISKDFNPDSQVDLGKRVKSRLLGLLPIDSLL